MSKFVITPKEDKSVTMTIRIDAALQEAYNNLAAQTNRSRNELIGMALQYALDNMEIKDSVAKNIELSGTEKSILDEAYNVIDRLDYLFLNFLVIDGEKMYTVKDIRKVLSLLEELIDAESIIAG